MMRIDDDFAHAELAQAGNGDLKQRVSRHFYQRLRPVIGQRTQARTQPGSQNHGFHWASFSSSKCRNLTSTPAQLWKCFASASARYTERCCPPVHPKETVRLLKPRCR